ncbi:MAG: orotate phosphoribosyltransferase [Tepidisphaeraceae bacterium]
MTRDQLIERIKSIAVLHGDFTLRSGRKSTYYIDKYRFTTDHEALLALGKLMAKHVTADVDRIAGAELGGVPLAAATAMEARRPFVIIRNQKKDYGTAKQVEGILNKGEKVLLVEDILTTGGQVLEAAKTLTEMGVEVVKIVACIDRLEGAHKNITEAGFAVEALFTTADLGLAGGPH